MLGQAVGRVFLEEGWTVAALSRAQLDVTDLVAVRGMLHEHRPDVVVQCAAFTRVDDAERMEDVAYQINTLGARNVAHACVDIGARFVYPSTNYVFNGEANSPYTTSDETAPINAYGRSKAAGENAAREAENFLIVRTAWLYGLGGNNFVRTVMNRLRNGQKMRIIDDQIGSPTWTMDLARCIARLSSMQVSSGVYHFTNSGSTSWFGLADETAGLLGLRGIESCRTVDYPTLARRPKYSVLDCGSTSELVGPIRDWRASLREAVVCGSV